VAAARKAWFKMQIRLDPRRLVFIDETSASTNMTRRYGRARGARLVCKVPFGHWKNSTLVAALRYNASRLLCCWMGRCKLPGLCGTDPRPDPQAWGHRHLDNVSVHKVASVREAIQACGATLRYLPPYSLDLNPIEKFIAKLTAVLRKAAARSLESLWSVIGSGVADFPALECAAYLANDNQPSHKMLLVALNVDPGL